MSQKLGVTRGLVALGLAIGMAVSTAPSAVAHSHKDWKQARKHVESRARTQRGARYSYGGSSPSGFDCSGFTRWVYAGHGANLPHSSMAQFDMAGRNGFKRVWEMKNLEVGDLVFFKTTSARVGHAGIYIGGKRFIHSSSSGHGVRIDRVDDPYYYRDRFVGATRVPATQRYP